jgi:acetylglutamate kinase
VSVKKVSVFKYGGNAMTDDNLKEKIVSVLAEFADLGHKMVVVHGGGPFIKKALESANIESEFVDGHRKTSAEALIHVEKALKGEVNADLVGRLNRAGQKAVGLSGKDGQMVIAARRFHRPEADGKPKDLGRVGDVERVDTSLLKLLLDKGYIPVLTCIAADGSGEEYNVNADMFAGHIAGALQADNFVVMTDVDGLLEDLSNPDSLIAEVDIDELQAFKSSGVVAGGMIPKVEACEIALAQGCKSARMVNGTDPDQLYRLLQGESVGTKIIKK